MYDAIQVTMDFLEKPFQEPASENAAPTVVLDLYPYELFFHLISKKEKNLWEHLLQL